MRITFVGNFQVDYSSENHHALSLESLGHEVIRMQEGTESGEDILTETLKSDLLVWVHTHGWVTTGLPSHQIFEQARDNQIPSLTYHLDLWLGLERQRDLESDPFYKSIGHFFTVDKLMADWFNENTEVKGHYLQAGVFDQECYMASSSGGQRDVIFVGSKGYHPEWQYRPQLIEWLGNTYQDRFTHVGGDGETGTVRGSALNQMYADSKVAVGDSLCLNFDYPYYWSDRVYETLGRGGFLIHPYIVGMEKHFIHGEHLAFYKFGDFDQLQRTIDYYIENDEERERIRSKGHEHVKANHTYKNRWSHIIEELTK